MVHYRQCGPAPKTPVSTSRSPPATRPQGCELHAQEETQVQLAAGRCGKLLLQLPNPCQGSSLGPSEAY